MAEIRTSASPRTEEGDGEGGEGKEADEEQEPTRVARTRFDEQFSGPSRALKGFFGVAPNRGGQEGRRRGTSVELSTSRPECECAASAPRLGASSNGALCCCDPYKNGSHEQCE